MGNFKSKIIFHPPELDETTYTQQQLDELIYIKNDMGNVTYFQYIDNNSEYTMIFSHGNSESIFLAKSWFDEYFFQYANVNVILYEYSGYSASNPEYNFSKQPVIPNEQLIYSDIKAVYTFLVCQLNHNPQNIIIYGRSLGGGPSIELASKYPVGGLILQSTFTSILRVFADFRFNIPGDCFINQDKISKIQVPIFLIHGVEDDIVPFEHSIKLYNLSKIKYEPLWVKGAGHNNLYEFGNKLYRKIRRYLKTIQQINHQTSQTYIEYHNYFEQQKSNYQSPQLKNLMKIE